MVNKEFLYKELSYQLKGCFFEIRNEYGPGQKESIYVNLIVEWLKDKNIIFAKEKTINIYSTKTGQVVGIYRPDLLVADKILVEVKSSRITTKQNEKQLYYYLRNSEYEIGYLVNFSTPQIYIKRIIYTNDRKPFLSI